MSEPKVYVASEGCLFDDHASAIEHDKIGPWGSFVDQAHYQKAITALKRILPIAEHYDPPAAHAGSCTPETSCDGSCADAYSIAKSLDLARECLRELGEE